MGTLLLTSEKGNPRLRQVINNSRNIKASNIATAKQENLAKAPPSTELGNPYGSLDRTGSRFYTKVLRSVPESASRDSQAWTRRITKGAKIGD